MNKNILFGILFLFSVFMISSISATLITPANSVTISGTASLNATNSSLPLMKNCTFYAFSPSTANSTWTNLGTFLNVSANAGSINGSFNSAILEDSNDYTFNASCRNTSNDLTSSISTATIIVSNTVPDAPTSISPADYNSLSTTGTQTFTSTVTDSKTTGCTYTIYRGGGSSDGESGTATYSASTCSFTKSFSSTTDNGNWIWCIIPSDGVSTASTCANFNVQIPNAGGGLLASSSNLQTINGVAYSTANEGESTNQTIYWIIGIVLVFIIGFLIYKNR